MRRVTLLVFGSMLCLIAGVQGHPVSAQQNLLTNPGFEQPYAGGYHRNTAQGWSPWVGAGDADFYPEQYGSVRSGVNSQAMLALTTIRDSERLNVGVYQVVSNIPVGSRVRASGWVSLFIYQIPDPANAGARGIVCIDPNGGTNPGDSDVVCGAVDARNGQAEGTSGWILPYTQIAVEAVTTGPSVTVFFRWRQVWGGLEQRAYFDDAALVILQQGDGTVPQSTAPSSAPQPTPVWSSFASPQEPRADGSIVHVVKSGNTISSIAVAYGVTVQEILALNPTIGDGRMIYVGQEILIRPAEGAEEPDDETTTPAAVSGSPEATVSVGPVTTAATWPTPIPPSPTVEPSPTPLPQAPVVVADASAVAGTTKTSVCVKLFEDRNTNLVQDQGEGLLQGGVISLKQGGIDLSTILTDTSPEPRCFDDLAAGEYTLQANPPTGYGLTTSSRLGIRVQPGETLHMTFGAAQGVESIAPPPADVVGQGSPQAIETSAADDDSELLRNIGIIVFGLAGISLLGGLGLAFVLRRR